MRILVYSSSLRGGGGGGGSGMVVEGHFNIEDVAEWPLCVCVSPLEFNINN